MWSVSIEAGLQKIQRFIEGYNRGEIKYSKQEIKFQLKKKIIIQGSSLGEDKYTFVSSSALFKKPKILMHFSGAKRLAIIIQGNNKDIVFTMRKNEGKFRLTHSGAELVVNKNYKVQFHY